VLVCVIKVEQNEESEKKYNIFVLFHNHGTFYFVFSSSLYSWIIFIMYKEKVMYTPSFH